MARASAPLNPRLIRQIVAAICTVCVAGMIVTAALRHVGGVITFGCLSTAGIVALMAVIGTSDREEHGEEAWSSQVDREQAVAVETLASQAQDEGASERTVRSLIGASVELGRSLLRSDR